MARGGSALSKNAAIDAVYLNATMHPQNACLRESTSVYSRHGTHEGTLQRAPSVYTFPLVTGKRIPMKSCKYFSLVVLPLCTVASLVLLPPEAESATLEVQTLGTAQDQRILDILETPCRFPAINNKPLADLAADLRRMYNINCEVDERALEAIGANVESLVVTAPERHGTLRAALNRLLANLDLMLVVTDDTLLITTPDEACAHMSVRVHDVTNVIGDWDTRDTRADKLINTIQDTIAPDSWEESGTGEGKITMYYLGGRSLLTVRQTVNVHDEITRYLSTLHHFVQPTKRSATLSDSTKPASRDSKVSAIRTTTGLLVKPHSTRKYVRTASESSPQIHESGR